MECLIRKIYRSVIIRLITSICGVLSILLRPFIKIQDNCILFWSWHSIKYNCNPKSISDYLDCMHPEEFIHYWSFKGTIPDNLPDYIIPLKWGSFKYVRIALKCKFLISNTRNDIYSMRFFKRKGQLYIMTWHAGMSLKKIEKDAEQTLSRSYIKMSKADSRNCDLMISGSEFQTNLFRNSFWYDGVILNSGTPRNDILFSDNSKIRKKTLDSLSIDYSSMIVLYAPTFRNVFNPDIISFDWMKIKKAILERFNKNAVLLVRLHPLISDKVNCLRFEFNNIDCFDMTAYPDMQELLIISDILITDYSSSMFDFALINKRCFLLAKDKEDYDRGFYIPLQKLPFQLCDNDDELEFAILKYDEVSNGKNIDNFNRNMIGSYEEGESCKHLYHWMLTCLEKNDCIGRS